jgi:hypothetical protein
MAFYGSHIGTAKIVADSSGLSYQDCFMKQAIFVKSKETTNLSVSPSLQRSLAEEGIQGLSKNPLNADVSKLGSVHSIENVGPFVDTLRESEAVGMPLKDHVGPGVLEGVVGPNLTINEPRQPLLTPDCFRPSPKGPEALSNPSRRGSPGVEGLYADNGPQAADSVSKLRPSDAGTSHSTETTFSSIIVGNPGVSPGGLIPPPQMLGGPFCPLKGETEEDYQIRRRNTFTRSGWVDTYVYNPTYFNKNNNITPLGLRASDEILMGGHKEVDIGCPSQSSTPLTGPPASPRGAIGHVTFDESRRLCFSESDLKSETDQDEITVNSIEGGAFRYPKSVSALLL